MGEAVLRHSTRRRLLVGVLLAFLAAVILIFDVWVVDSRERSKAADFFQFWAGGRAILGRDDPYDAQTWRQIYEEEDRYRWQTDQQVFPYPLWTAYVFVPLAILPRTHRRNPSNVPIMPCPPPRPPRRPRWRREPSPAIRGRSSRNGPPSRRL